MNREDIIKLARDCGINFHQAGWPELERFAAIVAAAEREAIIKTAEDLYFWDDSERLIKAIRARGQK